MVSGTAVKQITTMHMCPRVLVLHIKRFQFNHATLITSKRRESITLSATLDISRFCAPEMKFCSPELAASRPIYKLRSFLEHRGTVNKGHYISYSRNNDDSWCVRRRRAGNALRRLQQDDHCVTKFTAADALLAAQDAYILFFEVSITFNDLVLQCVCISCISLMCLYRHHHHNHRQQQQRLLFSAMHRKFKMMCSQH